MTDHEELCAGDLVAAETQEALKQIVEEMQKIKRQSQRVLTEVTAVHHQLDWKLDQILNQSTPAEKPWRYAVVGVFTILCLNLASLYYVVSNPAISSPEFVNTYVLVKKMKSVWGKLSQQEKERLAKYIE